MLLFTLLFSILYRLVHRNIFRNQFTKVHLNLERHCFNAHGYVERMETQFFMKIVILRSEFIALETFLPMRIGQFLQSLKSTEQDIPFILQKHQNRVNELVVTLQMEQQKANLELQWILVKNSAELQLLKSHQRELLWLHELYYLLL
mmetsp:Transcript_12612/g.22743  ORF Transcript_12612/g.22743 Transcript_12612/m.22743 type:complete len:147 (-) Transcript_12612:446-886(-)